MRLLRTDLHLLTGAYAVDAVDGPERDAFERHLRRCRSCDNEVQSLAATATGLAVAVAEPPPTGLRSRVLAATAVTRQLPPVAAVKRDRQRRVAAPWVPWLATGISVACLAIAVVFGVASSSAQHRLAVAQAQSRAIAAVLAAPDAQIASQPTSLGGTATVVVSRAEDAMVVTASGLPALPSSKVYQLWFIGPPRVRSAGLLPAARARQTALVLASGLHAGDRLGITVEPSGGTSSPTTKPIVLMSLPG